MSGEGYGAGEGEEVGETDAGEEIVPGGFGGRGEEEEAGEGEEGSYGGGPARGVGVGWADRWDDGEDWYEDHDQAGDEGGFGGCGEGEAGGLELIAGCEKEAYDRSGDEGL